MQGVKHVRRQISTGSDPTFSGTDRDQMAPVLPLVERDLDVEEAGDDVGRGSGVARGLHGREAGAGLALLAAAANLEGVGEGQAGRGLVAAAEDSDDRRVGGLAD